MRQRRLQSSRRLYGVKVWVTRWCIQCRVKKRFEKQKNRRSLRLDCPRGREEMDSVKKRSEQGRWLTQRGRREAHTR